MADHDDKPLTPPDDMPSLEGLYEHYDRKICEAIGSLAAPPHLLEPTGNFSSTPPAPIPKPVPARFRGDDDE